MIRKSRRIIILLLAGVGLLLCAKGVWIPAKALVAQVLLKQAWQQTIHQHLPTRAWSWADTWPVARLLAPGHDQDLIVLHGLEGASLAFGPGMLARGPAPGKPGTCILAGHRDTSFTFLEEVNIGDTFIIEDINEKKWTYKVVATAIKRADDLYIDQEQQARLALITCYPFHAVRPGTPLRYVVLADLVSAGPST